MCGASSQQKQISAEQTAFYKTLTDNYNKVFAGQQAILKGLTDMFTPILQAGPNQSGFSGAEKTVLQTEATEGVATKYNQAARAVAQRQGAAGGGDVALPSGVNAAEQNEVATEAAAQQSAEQQEITAEDYATGRQNFLEASRVLGGAASMENPTGFASAATTGGEAAASTAAQIAAANNAWMGPVAGAVGGVLGGVTSHFLPASRPGSGATA